MAIGNMHKNLVKIGHTVFELCKWTDKETDRQTDTQYNTSQPYNGKVINK